MIANRVGRYLEIPICISFPWSEWNFKKENCHRKIFKGRGQELEQAFEILWFASRVEGCGEISDSMVHIKGSKHGKEGQIGFPHSEILVISFKENSVWVWSGGSVVKSISCFFKYLISVPSAFRVTHNHLWVGFQRIRCPLPPLWAWRTSRTMLKCYRFLTPFFYKGEGESFSSHLLPSMTGFQEQR